MPDNVLDLDVLNPKPRIVKIGGMEIDVSFMPVGITFDVDEIVQEMGTFTVEELEQTGDQARRALELSVKLCSLFCSVKFPTMNEAWFQANASTGQIMAFSEVVKDTLTSSYQGVEEYSANQ